MRRLGLRRPVLAVVLLALGIVAIALLILRHRDNPASFAASPSSSTSECAVDSPPPNALFSAPAGFVGVDGRARMSVSVAGDQLAAITLVVADSGRWEGRTCIPGVRSKDTSIESTFPVASWNDQGRRTASGTMHLVGRITLAEHAAALEVRISAPSLDLRLDTQLPKSAEASAATTRVVTALTTNDVDAIAATLAPEARGPTGGTGFAGTIRGSGVKVTSVTPTGAGSQHWLASGYPVWFQEVDAAATSPNGSVQMHTTMVLIEEKGQWWLLETTAAPEQLLK